MAFPSKNRPAPNGAGKAGRASTPSQPGSPGPTSRKEPGRTLWPLLGVFAGIALAVCVVAALRHEDPDPHYLRAIKILRDYELGKDPTDLNYEDPTYPSALGELELVPATSVSFPPASALTGVLDGKIRVFRARLKTRQVQMEQAVKFQEDRASALAAAQAASTGIDVGAGIRANLAAATECHEGQTQKADANKH